MLHCAVELVCQCRVHHKKTVNVDFFSHLVRQNDLMQPLGHLITNIMQPIYGGVVVASAAVTPTKPEQ